MSDEPDQAAELTVEQLVGVLAEIDDALEPGFPIDLVVAGGVAMVSLFRDRLSGDVDVISPHIPQEVRDVAETIAGRHNLRVDWLNDAAKVTVPRLEPHPELLYEGRRLYVYSPGYRYLLAMKLKAARARDFDDAVLLARSLKITTAETAIDLVEQAWGHLPIDVRVEYFTQEVINSANDPNYEPHAAPERDPSAEQPNTGYGLT